MDPAGVAAWLRGRPVVRLTRAKGPGLVRQIELFEEEFGARPEPVQEASDLQTVLALVAAGVGAALVPAGAADIASATVRVTPIECDGGSTGDFDAVSWRIGAVWDPARVTRVRDNFLAVVRELARKRDTDSPDAAPVRRPRDRGDEHKGSSNAS